MSVRSSREVVKNVHNINTVKNDNKKTFSDAALFNLTTKDVPNKSKGRGNKRGKK